MVTPTSTTGTPIEREYFLEKDCKISVQKYQDSIRKEFTFVEDIVIDNEQSQTSPSKFIYLLLTEYGFSN